jgi:hypothetical protein
MSAREPSCWHGWRTTNVNHEAVLHGVTNTEKPQVSRCHVYAYEYV